jgi:ArsR family transcriptional regulator, arsenate/arsenite/antimonite-responsive transcriptional repressor / arsenate reductase (thioredoxin)
MGDRLTLECISANIESMSVESALARRVKVHTALGEPSRLAIVDRLTLGDMSPGELADMFGLPSNLLAHHLNVLSESGVVERVRSEGDLRRAYVRLVPGALAGLTPDSTRPAARVVFVCTHNSARSQFAVAAWARRTLVPAASAGTRPAARVHPSAVAVARRHNLPFKRVRTAHLDAVLRPDDLVVAVCDNAHEELGTRWPNRLHWSVPDPVRVGTDEAFEQALELIEDRVDRLATVVQAPEEA